jgi:Mce-associated membrane protein
MTEVMSGVDHVEGQFSRRPGRPPVTNTSADSASGQSGDATTHMEPSTDTAAAPADTVFSKDTDRPIGWFARLRRARITHPRRWIGALLLSTTLIATGCEGWLLLQKHRTAVAATQALGAAQAFTRGLTTIDQNRIDQNFTDVANGATGEFKNMYTAASAQLRRALIESHASAQGTVIDAAVKSATVDTVEVILFVDQSVRNSASPAPQLDRSRVTITMQRVDGRWLASKVDLS